MGKYQEEEADESFPFAHVLDYVPEEGLGSFFELLAEKIAAEESPR